MKRKEGFLEKTEHDVCGQAEKAHSTVKEKLLALAKGCTCASLSSGGDSGKTVAEKLDCCKLV